MLKIRTGFWFSLMMDLHSICQLKSFTMFTTQVGVNRVTYTTLFKAVLLKHPVVPGTKPLQGVESSVNPLEVLSIQDGRLGEGLHVWMHAKILILRNTFQYYNYCNCLSPWDVASFIKQQKKETLFYLLWCNE